MMGKPILKYVSLCRGCAIRTGSDAEITRQVGYDNLQQIRNATAHDVAWVKAMGGHVPDGRIAKGAAPKGEA